MMSLAGLLLLKEKGKGGPVSAKMLAGSIWLSMSIEWRGCDVLLIVWIR
jgi:hypothetical protein